jgi:hypothetical protein
MPNADGEKSTNHNVVFGLLRQILPLLITAFGVILAIVMGHVNAPTYVLVLILVLILGLALYTAVPRSWLDRLKTTIVVVRVFFKWIVFLIIFILLADVYISLRVPSAIKRAREGVRTIEQELERGELCSLDSQTRNPGVSRVRLWIHYDSMSFEPLVEELTSERGGVLTVSTLFYKNDHVVARRSPSSGATGFIQPE